MRNKNTVSLNSLSKTERLLWSSKVKQWIEQASIVITIILTGRKIDREDDKDAEEYNKAKGVLKESQTGRCGVSNGGIGVPGPKDHYSNPPTVSSLSSVRFSS